MVVYRLDVLSLNTLFKLLERYYNRSSEEREADIDFRCLSEPQIDALKYPSNNKLDNSINFE